MEENKLSEKPVSSPNDSRRRMSGRWKLLALLLVCAAPIIASYVTYYIIKPTGRTNYGTLIDLITSLEEAQAAGQLSRRLAVLTHPSLLVVDEIGYLPINHTGAVLWALATLTVVTGLWIWRSSRRAQV